MLHAAAPVTVVEPSAAVLDMHILHHLEPTAHGWRMREDDNGLVCVLSQH